MQQRPWDVELDARQTLRLGLACLLLATMLVVGTSLALRALDQQRSPRATAKATGTVTEIFGKYDDRATVEWTDAAGGRHEDDFSVYSGDDLLDQPFDVRYDPQDPDGRAFPADLDIALGPGQDAGTAGVVGGAGGGLLLLGWLVRLRRNARARRRAAAGQGVPMMMRTAHGSSRSVGRAYALLLPAMAPLPLSEQPARGLPETPAEGRPILEEALARAWHQPVVWEPVLDEVAHVTTPVTVYADFPDPGRAVVELPDGHRLTPNGRLLTRRPRFWNVRMRPAAALHDREELLQRPGADADRLRFMLMHGLLDQPAGPYSRTLRAVFRRRWWMLLVGAVLGYILAGRVGAALGAPCVLLLDAAIWCWYGGDPASE